jgi:hypothetical protein
MTQIELSTTDTTTDLSGLTRDECPYGCTPEKCVITGINLCGHPAKGGLQPGQKSDPEILRRYNAARRYLAHERTDAVHDAHRRLTEGGANV